MSKKNVFLKGYATNVIDESDEVTYYTNTFPSAIPLVYNHESAHPLESRFNEAYGNTFFLIYKPLGTMGFMKDDEDNSPFYLLLVRNAYTFDKYVSFFFNQSTQGGWHEQSFILRNSKIKCFGSVKLLMLNENKDKLYSRYRNAIALAFKDGKNPVVEGVRAISYLYHNDELIRTPGFLEWDKNIEKEFEYGHQWCNENEK